MSTELSQELQGQETKYTLAQLLTSEKFSRKLVEIMGSDENVKRFVQIGLQCLNRQPKLSECKQATVFDCLLKLSQIGLEPDGYHAHLVPFNNKVKGADGRDRWELQCQLITDYKGLINVVRRNPKVTVFKGGIIKLQDQFKFREGSDRVFSHEPVFPKPGTKLDNPIALVYAFIKWINGDWDVDIMTVDEVERIRERSRAKDFGPWVTDWSEMAMKTAIRHLSKRLELTYEERAIITADDDQFAYGNPFESAQAPRLQYTKPEFKDAPSEELQQAYRGVATEDRHTDNVERTKAEPDQPRKRRDQRGKADVQEADRIGQTESKQEPMVDKQGGTSEAATGSAGVSQQGSEEKEYKYGPGDDERLAEVVSNRGPQESDSKTSETGRVADTDSVQSANIPTGQQEGGGSSEEASAPRTGEKPASSQRDANAEERQRAAANLSKLVKNIQRDKIEEAKVVQVLIQFNQDVGFAIDSGEVKDLPDEAIDKCVRNWGSILFNVKKIAGQGEN